MSNLPLHGFTQNQIWLAIVALAVELTACLQMLALTDPPGHQPRFTPNAETVSPTRSVLKNASEAEADRCTQPFDSTRSDPS